jgi:predicted ArsR family transcriptional regulator
VCRLATEVALGGLHPIRRWMIEFLVPNAGAHTASTIAARVCNEETTARRHLEDLVALGVIDLAWTRPDRWKASE